MAKLSCFSCYKEIEFNDSIGRRDECPYCRNDLHVCKNCRHYDPKVYNECKETQAEVIREKERANFCDFFESGGAGGNSARETAEALRARAEALFKK